MPGYTLSDSYAAMDLTTSRLARKAESRDFAGRAWRPPAPRAGAAVGTQPFRA